MNCSLKFTERAVIAVKPVGCFRVWTHNMIQSSLGLPVAKGVSTCLCAGHKKCVCLFWSLSAFCLTHSLWYRQIWYLQNRRPLTVCVYGSKSGDNWVWTEKQANDPSLGFSDSSDGEESSCNAGDLGSVPGSQRSPGGGYGYPLQYFFLENPTDESGGLQSIGSQRVGCDWSNLACTHACTHTPFIW